MRRLLLTSMLGAIIAVTALMAMRDNGQSAIQVCEQYRDWWRATFPDGSVMWGWMGDSYEHCWESTGEPPTIPYEADSPDGKYSGRLHDVSPLDALNQMCENCKNIRQKTRDLAQHDRAQCEHDAIKVANDYCDDHWPRTVWTGEYHYANCGYVPPWYILLPEDEAQGYEQITPTSLCQKVKIYETNDNWVVCQNNQLDGKGTNTASTTITIGAGSEIGKGLDISYGDTTGTIQVDSSEGLLDWCQTQANEDFKRANKEYKDCRDKVNKVADDYGIDRTCY